MDLSKMMSDGEFAKLRAVVYAQTGISIGDARRSLLVSRLRPRMRELGLSSYKEYLARVDQDPAEKQQLTNCVTTNETYFYRTPRVWSYFNDVFVSGFIAKERKRAIRVWSAAASTGEEAHTAGVFLEEVRQRAGGFDYSILGTDISSRVIDVATAGIYKGRPIARFRKENPEIFTRQMTGSDEMGWSVAPQISSRIRFQQHNLLKALTSTAPFDVIFLRNVLIYFKAEDQQQILRNVRSVLHPEGVLFIGESESLKHMATDFEQIEPIIYRPTRRLGEALA